MIYSLYIINRYGGMLYHNQFNTGTANSALSNNDHLRLASTFHGFVLREIASFFVFNF